MDVERCSIFVTYISLAMLHASAPTVLANNDFKAATIRRCKSTHYGMFVSAPSAKHNNLDL